jgi:hypothetical protein
LIVTDLASELVDGLAVDDCLRAEGVVPDLQAESIKRVKGIKVVLNGPAGLVPSPWALEPRRLLEGLPR